MQKFWIIAQWGPNEERRGDVGEHLENHVAHLDFNPCIWILKRVLDSAFGFVKRSGGTSTLRNVLSERAFQSLSQV